MTTMVSKTYALSPEDQERLISMICRYHTVKTQISEIQNRLIVSTCFGDNDEPTSAAGNFDLEVVSEEKPGMPADEHRRRVEGRP